MNKMVYLEKTSGNLTLSTLCSQRKLIDWQIKNEGSGDEDGDSGSDKENLPVFDWIINIKLVNENFKQVIM